MPFVLPSFLHTLLAGLRSCEKINCFHCDDKMRKDEALWVTFNGSLQPVCCHGCLAVLQIIERNDMIQNYLHSKSLDAKNESHQ